MLTDSNLKALLWISIVTAAGLIAEASQAESCFDYFEKNKMSSRRSESPSVVTNYVSWNGGDLIECQWREKFIGDTTIVCGGRAFDGSYVYDKNENSWGISYGEWSNSKSCRQEASEIFVQIDRDTRQGKVDSVGIPVRQVRVQEDKFIGVRPDF